MVGGSLSELRGRRWWWKSRSSDWCLGSPFAVSCSSSVADVHAVTRPPRLLSSPQQHNQILRSSERNAEHVLGDCQQEVVGTTRNKAVNRFQMLSTCHWLICRHRPVTNRLSRQKLDIIDHVRHGHASGKATDLMDCRGIIRLIRKYLDSIRAIFA